MIILLRYRETLQCIAELCKGQMKDPEVQMLLKLIVLSVFVDMNDYAKGHIERRIKRLLGEVGVTSPMLYPVYATLFEETLEYLPGFKPHLPEHCVPSSCLTQKTFDTFRIILGPYPIIRPNQYNPSIKVISADPRLL